MSRPPYVLAESRGLGPVALMGVSMGGRWRSWPRPDLPVARGGGRCRLRRSLQPDRQPDARGWLPFAMARLTSDRCRSGSLRARAASDTDPAGGAHRAPRAAAHRTARGPDGHARSRPSACSTRRGSRRSCSSSRGRPTPRRMRLRRGYEQRVLDFLDRHLDGVPPGITAGLNSDSHFAGGAACCHQGPRRRRRPEHPARPRLHPQAGGVRGDRRLRRGGRRGDGRAKPSPT